MHHAVPDGVDRALAECLRHLVIHTVEGGGVVGDLRLADALDQAFRQDVVALAHLVLERGGAGVDDEDDHGVLSWSGIDGNG